MKESQRIKGTISVTEDRGRLRIRWRHQGVRYSLNHSYASPLNHLAARKLALQIEQDIALDCFDPSLNKYTGKVSRSSSLPQSFTELFEHWVKNYKQMDCNIHTNYYSTRNMIKKWGDVDSSNLVTKLNQQPNAAVTYNRRLTILKSFVNWLVEQRFWDRNPLLAVQRKKVKHKKHENRKPFTEDEIKNILHAIKTNAACSRYASTKHSFYYPFIYFLFKTGVRNAEAVGLRIKHINKETRLIHIKEVLARTLKSTTSKNRVRKSTKNEKERYLPFTDDLREIIEPLIAKKKPDDLVFTSPSGKALDDQKVLKRVFKPVLKYLSIEDRVLYACRHTFGSRCIDEGITPVMTAFLMGNNPETALKRYTHQLKIPDTLPSL